MGEDPRKHRIRVGPLPAWLDARRLLGDGTWEWEDEATGRFAMAHQTARASADVAARMRGLGFGGYPVEVEVVPSLRRPMVRQARLEDARRRRKSRPGWGQAGFRTDEEGRWSLTPEDLARMLGRWAKGAKVLDACCGAGGSTIGFAREGCTVRAIDPDPKRLSCARHNARLHGVSRSIEFERGKAEQLIGAWPADIVFVDPPWGTDWDRRCASPDDLPLLAQLRALTRLRLPKAEFWGKVPPSFDTRMTPKADCRAIFGTGEGDRQRVKFLLLRWAPESTLS